MSCANLNMTTPGHLEHVLAEDGNSMFVVRISKMKISGLPFIDLTLDSCSMKIKEEEKEEEEVEVEEKDWLEHHEGPLFFFKDNEEKGLFYESDSSMAGDDQQEWDSNKGDVGETPALAFLVSEYPRINKVEFRKKYKDMDEEDTLKKYIEDPDFEME
jgi:hypothetical protein